MNKLLKILQMIFYLIIGLCTIYSLWFNVKQSNLIFTPIIGIEGIESMTMLTNIEDKDVYENVKAVKINFIIKNVGNMSVKNFRTKTTGKSGDTILFVKEIEKNKGITMIPQNVCVNTTTINKNILDMLVEKNEKLTYKIEFFYTDWASYKEYNYSCYVEILVNSKNPLNLDFRLLSEIEF